MTVPFDDLADIIRSRRTHMLVDRDRPCYRKEECESCGRERENPDHDWAPGTNALGEMSLTCSRCNLEI